MSFKLIISMRIPHKIIHIILAALHWYSSNINDYTQHLLQYYHWYIELKAPCFFESMSNCYVSFCSEHLHTICTDCTHSDCFGIHKLFLYLLVIGPLVNGLSMVSGLFSWCSLWTCLQLIGYLFIDASVKLMLLFFKWLLSMTH